MGIALVAEPWIRPVAHAAQLWCAAVAHVHRHIALHTPGGRWVGSAGHD